MLMAVMVGVLVMLCDVFLRSLWFGGGRRSRRRSRQEGGGGAMLVLLIIAIVAGSVELTRNPEGLAKALAKLAGDQEVLEVANRATAPLYIVHPIKKFEARAKSIFSTHPPIEDRIKRLMSLTR